MRRGGNLAAGAAIWAAAGALLTGAGAPQQYRSAVDVVPIYATVTDAAGRLVPDLTEADFEVRDNGKTRPITLFSADVQPISVAIVLDRSGSMMSHANVVEHAAEKFVERMLPSDRARIGDFGQYIRFQPDDFTSDHDTLLDLLQNGLQSREDSPSPVWTAMMRAVNAVSAQGGRKVVLAFTDGKDAPAWGQERTGFDAVRRRAEENEVMFYAIACPSEQAAAGVVVLGRQYGGGTRFTPPDKKLKQLAEATGGGHLPFDWAQNLDVLFTRVAEELHRQYLIGFVPAALDGKSHRVEVRVQRRDLTVRARGSYVAVSR